MTVGYKITVLPESYLNKVPRRKFYNALENNLVGREI